MTEVVVHESEIIAARDGWPDEKIALVKATVAKGATDDELQMFLALAQRYQLDPFAREIWCICRTNDDGSRKVNGKTHEPEPAQITVSRDGLLSVANRHPAYTGITSDVVFQGDSFKRTADGVQHEYDLSERKSVIVGAYALVYRSDRNVPAYFFARKAEYSPETPGTYSPWKKYPSAMIMKVAEANALKRAFSISGVVTEDEITASEPSSRPTYEEHVARFPAIPAPREADPPAPVPPNDHDPTAVDDAPGLGDQTDLLGGAA